MNLSILGDYVSLNDIENKMIFKWFHRPLAHFALSSISFSSPPFRSEYYNGEKIETQLDDQAKQFIAKFVHCNRYDKDENVLYLSSLFKWFRADFGVSDRDLTIFIAEYNEEVVIEIDPTIIFLPFDWKIDYVK